MALFEADRIHKRFGARVVLEEVSLSFEEGRVAGVMGPNGAGKTTCFHILTGHHRPDRGRIRFAGEDLTGMPPQRIARRGVARSFQLMNLFDDSVAIENVMLAMPSFRERQRRVFAPVFSDEALVAEAWAVLADVGLAGREWTVAKDLPYGDRRALEIGVALAAKPRILFLDEPTQGLGAEGVARLGKLVERIRHRTTVVLIEHDMRFLFSVADRISVIHWGQVIAEGAPSELVADKWVRRSALGEAA
jgi:branched-chain amino acid transport system ATP-binding protein